MHEDRKAPETTARLPAGAGADSAGLRRWKVEDILGPHREVILEHAGQDYRLRLTANNRLILTK